VNRRTKPLPAVAKSADGSGLRQRKLQATRERLTRAAMALFLERGFEATTIDDIAAAADVSRRSFFHYFASKEDVVAAWQEGAAAALVAEVVARPAGETMLTAAENAIAAALKTLDNSEVIGVPLDVASTATLTVAGACARARAPSASRPSNKFRPTRAPMRRRTRGWKQLTTRLRLARRTSSRSI